MVVVKAKKIKQSRGIDRDRLDSVYRSGFGIGYLSMVDNFPRTVLSQATAIR